MKKGTRGAVTLHIDAPPEEVYALVSDVTRMPEWSPETIRCRWLDGATGPVVGARFKGTNRRGVARWSTRPRVVTADAGCEFAFVVDLVVVHRPMTQWSYRFEPTGDGGTDVTEAFEMMNDMPWYVSASERLMMGVSDRKADLEAGMRRTLECIKDAAERQA